MLLVSFLQLAVCSLAYSPRDFLVALIRPHLVSFLNQQRWVQCYYLIQYILNTISMKPSESAYLELLYLFVFLKIGTILEQMENGFGNRHCIDVTTSLIHTNQCFCKKNMGTADSWITPSRSIFFGVSLQTMIRFNLA